MAAPPKDDDPRQLGAQLDLVQRELQRTERRLEALEQAMAEAQQAAAALRHLSESKGMQDILLPIGAGMHVAAQVDAAGKVLTPLGAGYFTEGEAPAAVAALEERANAIAQQFQEASQDAERLAQVGAAINQRLLNLQDAS